jgi:hypothetical protein
MGQGLSAVIEQLTRDGILACPNCAKGFNLSNRTPIMVCANQHNFCEDCIEEVSKTKNCFECKEQLLTKRKKNTLLCYLIDKLNLNEESSSKSEDRHANQDIRASGSKLRHYESAENAHF